MKLPTITIIIPVKNEERNIELCLKSIFEQEYPRKLLEVIIADDSSTDSTVQIAKKYPVKILAHQSSDAEVGKAKAIKIATGELCMYLDADIHLRGRKWLQKMVFPLLNDQRIVGSFTKYCSDSHSSTIERYLNLDPLQRDCMYQFFSASVNSCVIKKTSGYDLCQYTSSKIPPAGLCLYRRRDILPLLKGQRRFLELDLLVKLVKNNKTFFAYVPTAGLFHHHASTLSHLIKKRMFNVTRVYLTDNEQRLYRWFNLSELHGLLKVILWVLIANSFLPLFLRGLYLCIKNRTWIGLYEPFVGLLVTDAVIFAFLLDNRGRALLKPPR
jgi:glycosyltransferase involved in cell wall biosynthesis